MDTANEQPAPIRFEPPPGWASAPEPEAGVTAFDAPGGLGRLRLIVERKPAAADGAAALREWALRYLRPDDGRVGDRLLEDHGDGGIRATATLRGSETHYLWLVGWAEDGSVLAAMFAFTVSAERDGDEAAAAAAEAVDEAIRAIRRESPSAVTDAG